MRSELVSAAVLALLAICGCDNTAPESAAFSCEPMDTIEASAETYYIYLSPAGNDENDGGEAAPVATLRGAQDILRDERPDSDVIVRIRSDRGDYYNQSVPWEYFDSEHNITFESWPDSLYAHFVQGTADTTFFYLKASAGRRTNIHIKKLFVQGYVSGAIWFWGEEQDESGWNAGNTISDCIMQDIGNQTQPERHMCWGVLDFVNSRSNVIRDCVFIDCGNANTNAYPQDGAMSAATGPNLPIIGIYLAHHTSCNLITGCSFYRVKGDAVRIRDDSNGNEICQCCFQQTGWTAVCTMWYQLPTHLSSAAGECPSWNNLFHHNRAEGNWLCGEPRLFYNWRTESARQCANQPDRHAYHIRMWANESSACAQ